MAILWRYGRMVGAAGRGVRLTFQEMPEEGVEAFRMLKDGEFAGVLWFAPFSAYAEVVVDGKRELLEDYDCVEGLVEAVLALLAESGTA